MKTAINIIKEFMDMKPGLNFLRNVHRIACALETIVTHLNGIAESLSALEMNVKELKVEIEAVSWVAETSDYKR